MKPYAKFAAVGITLLLVAIVLFTEGVLIPKRLQPNVLALTFKEYRDDGGPMAVFEMVNSSGTPIVVWEDAQLITHAAGKMEEQDIRIARTMIQKGASAQLSVPVPENTAWQVAFRAARFGPKEQKQFDGGQMVEGTIVFSDVVPPYKPAP